MRPNPSARVRWIVGLDGASQTVESGLAGAWDLAFLAIEETRPRQLDFTAPYVVLEGTYLVRDDSPYRTVLDVDREGVRVAVGQGGFYDLRLTRTLRHAQLVRAPTNRGAVKLYDFPHDPQCFAESDDMMLGANLLVAAVVEPGQRERRVWLPRGSAWYDFWSGERHEGGQWVALSAPLSYRDGECGAWQLAVQCSADSLFIDVQRTGRRPPSGSTLTLLLPLQELRAVKLTGGVVTADQPADSWRRMVIAVADQTFPPP